MFSARLPQRLESNALAHAIARARRSGRPLVDLTISNPTAAGIRYPEGLFRSLAAAAVAHYQPSPFGLASAREAVSADYARRGLRVPPDRIVLTSSTSEAYSLLFKLTCAPCGDSVLVPAPSYPLFEHLTALDGVTARAYRLDYDGRWWLDTSSVDEVWEAGTKAVLAVSPNNPTGSVLTPAEQAALESRCAARGAALIVDEVFADYPLAEDAAVTAAGAAAPDALTFRLGGLSKSAALPQIKLGWIAVDGPATARRCGAGAARTHLRHVSVGVDAGPGGGARPDRGRRGAAAAGADAHTIELRGARARRRVASGGRGPACGRRLVCCPPNPHARLRGTVRDRSPRAGWHRGAPRLLLRLSSRVVTSS